MDENRSAKNPRPSFSPADVSGEWKPSFPPSKESPSAVSGYAGGSKANAHYEIVSTGTTGHAESVQVTFDPSQVSFGQLLKIYFSVAHDPTELNRQGPDEGTQYRSEIFYTSDEQKRIAEAYIQQLTAAKVFQGPIVTKVAPLQAFYRGGRLPSGLRRAQIRTNPTSPITTYPS